MMLTDFQKFRIKIESIFTKIYKRNLINIQEIYN